FEGVPPVPGEGLAVVADQRGAVALDGEEGGRGDLTGLEPRPGPVALPADRGERGPFKPEQVLAGVREVADGLVDLGDHQPLDGGQFVAALVDVEPGPPE